jgi:hypothetical protein
MSTYPKVSKLRKIKLRITIPQDMKLSLSLEKAA